MRAYAGTELRDLTALPRRPRATRGLHPAWLEVLAAAFGIGAGLTLDEFALWVHLEDVYWSREGRASIDAVVIAALLGGLIVLGVAPFDLPSHRMARSTARFKRVRARRRRLMNAIGGAPSQPADKTS